MSPKPITRLQKSKERLNDLSFARMLPNIATVIALCVGLSSIRFALLGKLDAAMLSILVAAFFDMMDGRLARLLGASSDFGAELDSLSDFVCFGAAPAVVLYIVSMNQWGGIGWGVSLFFAVCCGLRLARFNILSRTDQSAQPSWAKQFFVGVPAPAGAMIAFLPLITYLATDLRILLHPILCSIFLILGGVLFISRLPAYSFKTVKISPSWVPMTLLIVGLLVALLITDPWATIALIVTLYLGTLPFSYLHHNRLAAKPHPKEPKGPTP